jgi:deoxyribonuclease V
MMMEFISPESEMRIPDLRRIVCQVAAQIPRGMVSTYGDIARALGDVRASRVVGMIMAANERPIVMPCHRVVYSDGRVGWYGGMGKGNDRKVELLDSEGVMIDHGVVQDFEGQRFQDFQIEPILSEMMEEQRRLRERVMDEDPIEVERVVGLDVAYQENMGFSAAASFDLESGDLIEERVARKEVKFPYIPGYLSYRELPLLTDLIDKDENAVYLVDGQGSLHPRRFGIACHLGVFMDVPTIGVAKSLLCGEVDDSGGDSVPVYLDGELAGMMLKKNGGKGIYVSVGHRTSLPVCESICRRFMKHRLPEPLRKAHALANQARVDWRRS